MIARRDTRNRGDATAAPALRIDPETPLPWNRVAAGSATGKPAGQSRTLSLQARPDNPAGLFFCGPRLLPSARFLLHAQILNDY
jgi:hypothetical protein